MHTFIRRKTLKFDDEDNDDGLFLKKLKPIKLVFHKRKLINFKKNK